jgi:hypothetical protein
MIAVCPDLAQALYRKMKIDLSKWENKEARHGLDD